ncbi:MAG: PilZ domain-containing protein [Candidatus Omnitrophica bacterium]|nr:PilZ domain-containing protein [Candidatus Omnitrophota bacterium]
MKKKNANLERRRSQRFATSMPLKISGEDFHLVADTKNLSSSGIYCLVERYIPVMTKVSITMFIPLIEKKVKMHKQVNCTAVVVRIEPDDESPAIKSYAVGLFFTDLKDTERNIITKYLQQLFLVGSN